jgi:lysophospholipase L1-like esterase
VLQRGLLLLGIAGLAAALVWASPELRRRLRPPLERLGLLRPYQESAGYVEILERHRLENARLEAGCVVLLGDSLSEAFPSHLAEPRGWVARGISGDRVRHVAARLAPSALEAPCGTVALLAGSNDVAHDGRAPADVAAELAALARTLRGGGKRVVLTTPPPARGRFRAANPALRELSERIRGLSGEGFAVADLHAALADPDGELAARHTRDGLHLTEPAYARWAALLDAALGANDPGP